MKEVLPELLVPRIRMLKGRGQRGRERERVAGGGAHLNGVGSFLLRMRRGLFTPEPYNSLMKLLP